MSTTYTQFADLLQEVEPPSDGTLIEYVKQKFGEQVAGYLLLVTRG